MNPKNYLLAGILLMTSLGMSAADYTVTGYVTAVVDANTGHVEFLDKTGKVLLNEVGGGKGSILLFGPEMEWSDQKPADNITVYVYAGKDGEFTLYEDENTNYNYEKGAYATINFKFDNAKRTLTISDRKGEFPGMLKTRRFNIVLRTPQVIATGLDPDAANGKKVEYKGKKLTVKL